MSSGLQTKSTFFAEGFVSFCYAVFRCKNATFLFCLGQPITPSLQVRLPRRKGRADCHNIQLMLFLPLAISNTHPRRDSTAESAAGPQRAGSSCTTAGGVRGRNPLIIHYVMRHPLEHSLAGRISHKASGRQGRRTRTIDKPQNARHRLLPCRFTRRHPGRHSRVLLLRLRIVRPHRRRPQPQTERASFCWRGVLLCCRERQPLQHSLCKCRHRLSRFVIHTEILTIVMEGGTLTECVRYSIDFAEAGQWVGRYEAGIVWSRNVANTLYPLRPKCSHSRLMRSSKAQIRESYLRRLTRVTSAGPNPGLRTV